MQTDPDWLREAADTSMSSTMASSRIEAVIDHLNCYADYLEAQSARTSVSNIDSGHENKAALEADDGPEAFFIELRRNDAKTFANIAAKLIPSEFVGDVRNEVDLSPEFRNNSDLAAARRIAWLFHRGQELLEAKST